MNDSGNIEVILKYFSDLTSQQLDQFLALSDLYQEWNSKINLISRKDIDSLYERHILHSLSIAAVFDFKPGSEIIDIGTGGGFPGIPLAIFYPEVKFHLVDSITKKIKAVNAIAEFTGLRNVTTQHIRAEEIKNMKFDFVVSRAVAPLKDLWNWSIPLLKKSSESPALSSESKNSEFKTKNPELKTSSLICLKGGDLSMEIRESNLHPGIIEISKIFPEDFFKQKHLLYVSL